MISAGMSLIGPALNSTNPQLRCAVAEYLRRISQVTMTSDVVLKGQGLRKDVIFRQSKEITVHWGPLRTAYAMTANNDKILIFQINCELLTD